MALMSGLVETMTDRSVGSQKSTFVEWVIRNAFAVVLGTCTLFWAAVAAIVIVL